VFVIFSGAVIASWGDMNSNIIGIILGVFAVMLFAFQLVEANRIGNNDELEIHPLEMNYYQSFIIVPITLAICI